MKNTLFFGILLTVLLCLSGCYPLRPMYEQEDADRIAQKGTELMQDWLSKNMPGAKLRECTEDRLMWRGDGNKYLTGYAYGSIEDKDQATEFKEQIAYRQRNAKELENFTISRQLGKNEYIMYIEEVNDIPTRFFVTNRSDYKAVNPDIIFFKDVVSCVTDVDERHEEIKQRNSEGQMVSCRPPRYKHHYNFYIRMEIRNNPYFHEIKFRINSSDIVLETEGDVGGGIGGAVLAGVLQGAGISTVGAQADTPGNFSEKRRYAECAMICQKIEQAVEDGKRGAQPVVAAPASPVQEAPRPKFCPNCGAPYEGGKFCQYCGSKL